MSGKKIVCVLSGGLDSTILLYKLVNEYGNKNVFAITFNYAQNHSIELQKAKITCQKLNIIHKIIDISFLGDIVKDVSALSANGTVEMPTINDVIGDPQPATYVPFRNLILVSLSLAFAESNNCSEIYTGFQCHDEYSYFDTSQSFVDSLNNVTILNRKNPIKIIAPFIDMAKVDEIKIGIDLGVPFEDTHTCYDPVSGLANSSVLTWYSCGKCPSCSERIMNFAKAGIKDPVPYLIEIPWEDLINGKF
jgi:7-cyano-7-deazaguanine synthase